MAARETQPEFKSTGGKYESCVLYFDANQAYNLEEKKKRMYLVEVWTHSTQTGVVSLVASLRQFSEKETK